MKTRGRGRLGRRVLRLGAKGPDVRELQEFLRRQGYEIGIEDDYGYLTKYAVREFQKEHGLVADGIAGKRFFALILGENVPIRRRIHIVQPKETLKEISEQYSVGPEAFAKSRSSTKLTPGQKLLFFEREIWGICPQETNINGYNGQVTGLVCEPGSPSFTGMTSVVQPDLSLTEDPLKLHGYLRRPKLRRRLVQELADYATGFNGLYLPWQRVDPLSGARYLKLLKSLRKKLSTEQMLWLDLGPGVPPLRMWGGINYLEVNSIACRVVLSLPIPTLPGPILDWQKAEELLNSLGTAVHSWKILLRIPVYAVEWKIGEDKTEYLKLPYSKALTRAFRHGARLDHDEDGALYYRYRSRDGELQLRLPQFNNLCEILSMVNRRNLAGVILDQLGMEDNRTWSALSSFFRLARL